jgi:hypothetical protein
MNRESVSNVRMTLAAKGIIFIMCSLSLLALSGCSSTKTSAPVAITFTQGQAPPSSVMASSTTQFSATVTNDTQNLGVSWLLTCGAPVPQCGSLTRHTASGEPTTYIAPASIPPGGTVTIQANSSAVPSAGITTTITVTPYVSGPISVAFNPAPPATVTIGTVLPLSVIVTNDVIGSNGKPEGATLSVTCQVAGTCGYFSGNYYVPPPTIPTGNTVTITATSVADPSASASATLTVLPPVVTISLVTTPPASIPAGSATNLSAYVTDGTLANAAGQMGIDWSVSCSGGGACGSFIPTHTASVARNSSQQVTTAFTAPSTVPSGGTVTITASATASPTTQASVTITITPVTLNNALLSGQYAFFLSGVNTTGQLALAGSLIADGNGNITAAEESLPGGTTLTGITGSYYIGSDGRGLLTLNGAPNYTWLNGQQIFSLAVVDSTQVFMEEFDGTDPYNIRNSPIAGQPYGETVRGELDLQQSNDFSVPLSGPYAFAWTQTGSVSPFAGYYGGVLDADSSGNISSFAIDRYLDGQTTSITSGTYGAQSFSTVDSFGYGTVSIGPYSLNYFLVDSGHFIVIGSSSSDSTGLPGGHVYSQPAAMPSFAGTYIFTLAGSTPLYSQSGTSVNGSNPQALGGLIASDADGNMNGYLDTNNQGTVESASVTGTLVASAVPGRWLMTLEGGGASSFALYPTSNNGLFLFQLDFGKSGIGTVALQSSSTPAISGNYTVSIQQPGGTNVSRNVNSGLEVGAWTDISGQIIASNSSTLSGTLDIDQINGVYEVPSGNIWTQTPDQAVTGTFASGAQGRFTGTITVNQTVTTPGQLGTLSEIFYVIDSSHVMLLENDSTPATGFLELENF